MNFIKWIYWNRIPTWLTGIGVLLCCVGFMCLPFGYIHERNFTSLFEVSKLTGVYAKYGILLFLFGILFLISSGILKTLINKKLSILKRETGGNK